MPEPQADAWSAATFEGAAAAQVQTRLTATPEELLAWLEAALRLAEAAGTIAAVREQRQRAVLADWESH